MTSQKKAWISLTANTDKFPTPMLTSTISPVLSERKGAEIPWQTSSPSLSPWSRWIRRKTFTCIPGTLAQKNSFDFASLLIPVGKPICVGEGCLVWSAKRRGFCPCKQNALERKIQSRFVTKSSLGRRHSSAAAGQSGTVWLRAPSSQSDGGGGSQRAGSKCRDRPWRRKLLGEEENLSLFMSCSQLELHEFGVRQSPALQSVLTPILRLVHLLPIGYFLFDPKEWLLRKVKSREQTLSSLELSPYRQKMLLWIFSSYLLPFTTHFPLLWPPWYYPFACFCFSPLSLLFQVRTKSGTWAQVLPPFQRFRRGCEQSCTPWVSQDKQAWQGPLTAQEPGLKSWGEAGAQEPGSCCSRRHRYGSGSATNPRFHNALN